MCKCKRGEGVKKEGHECKMWNNTEVKDYWHRSERYWEEKVAKVRNGSLKKGYTASDHMDWADKHNYGITHFGIHPDLLNRENIRYDTFHLKCAITRALMSYVRSFTQNYMSVETNMQFMKELGEFWNEYHTTVWDTNRSFASFKGNELALFVANTGAIVDFLKRKVSRTQLRENLTESLELWTRMFKVLGITWIADGSEYLKEVDRYEKNVKRLYELGGESFLSRKSNAEKDKGYNETFYFHVLRYYLPAIMKDTFEKHHLGIGIFTMQGFERRNKESKLKMTRNSNFKGKNTIRANLEKLWTKLFHSKKNKSKNVKQVKEGKKSKNKKKQHNDNNNNVVVMNTTNTEDTTSTTTKNKNDNNDEDDHDSIVKVMI